MAQEIEKLFPNHGVVYYQLGRADIYKHDLLSLKPTLSATDIDALKRQCIRAVNGQHYRWIFFQFIPGI